MRARKTAGSTALVTLALGKASWRLPNCPRIDQANALESPLESPGRPAVTRPLCHVCERELPYGGASRLFVVGRVLRSGGTAVALGVSRTILNAVLTASASSSAHAFLGDSGRTTQRTVFGRVIACHEFLPLFGLLLAEIRRAADRGRRCRGAVVRTRLSHRRRVVLDEVRAKFRGLVAQIVHCVLDELVIGDPPTSERPATATDDVAKRLAALRIPTRINGSALRGGNLSASAGQLGGLAGSDGQEQDGCEYGHDAIHFAERINAISGLSRRASAGCLSCASVGSESARSGSRLRGGHGNVGVGD